MAAGDLLVPAPVTRLVLVNNTSAAYVIGQFVLISAQLCRCLVGIAAGGSGAADILGVFEIAKTAGQAWVLGQDLYWDAVNLCITTVAGANVHVGTAYLAATAGAATGFINLNAN